MKFTSKISLIIAIALLISVGGVYAQWIYVNYVFNPANEYSENVEVGLEVSQINTITTSQTGTINVSNGFSGLMIDQLDNSNLNNLNYKGKLVWGGQAALVSFVPSNVQSSGGGDAAPSDIDIRVTIKINGTNECTEGHTILLLDDAELAAEEKFETVDHNTHTATIILKNVDDNGVSFDLSKYIKLNEEFELPTIEKYNATKGIIDSLSITLTMEDMTTPPQSLVP